MILPTNWRSQVDARKDDIRIISSIAENSEEEKFRKYLNSWRHFDKIHGVEKAAVTPAELKRKM